MVLVAIQSVKYPDRYVSLDGQGVTRFLPQGGGRVITQTYIGTWETFVLVENSDDTVSLKSTVFDNVFLRLDATGVAQGQTLPNGGGVVNAQYTANTSEKFRIQKKVNGSGNFYGIVGIESSFYPGRYLRMDGGVNKVNVQGVFGDNEEFRILVVGK